MRLSEWKDALNKFGAAARPFLFMIDFEMERPIALPLDSIDPKTMLYNFNGCSNAVDAPQVKETQFLKQPIDFEIFQKSFRNVQKHLVYGNSFLTNLTFPTPIKTNLNLFEVFYQSKQPYKLWYKKEFVVFSPEKFVQISNNTIHSYPMKGTIDASVENAEDKILANKKEAAEHATIVDLIRNDLSTVASKVTLEKYRYIDVIRTNQKDLLQVSSHISGQLPENWKSKLGDILLKLLPAGSISGAPKDKTLEVIRESELDKRGYYTGVMGIFDGTKVDSAVMIRYVERQGEKLVFRSGGGITAQSNVREEYNEMVDKVYFPWRK